MGSFIADENQGYSWEQGIERTWDDIKEDGGSLAKGIKDMERIRSRQALNRLRRRLRLKPERVRRGMMRHLFVVLDMSDCMDLNDIRPSRLDATVSLVEQFIVEFFEQNPISQLGLIVTRSCKAERITDLSGNPRKHVQMLRDKASTDGEPSLQNAFELAQQTLRSVPAYASREILVVMGSLSTCDPANILDTVEELKKNNITVSIIGLAAAVKVCETICQRTLGSYAVVQDDNHFKELLMAHLTPPRASPDMDCSLMCMGFPHHEETDKVSLCTCHDKLTSAGYHCSRCGCKYCEVPTECNVCGLTLVSSPHIARFYRHLFMPPSYEEVKELTEKMPSLCYGCMGSLSTESGLSQCPECRHFFCIDCDVLVHGMLNTCPGCCESNDNDQTEAANEGPGQQTNEDVPMTDIVVPSKQTNQVPGQQTNEDVSMIDIVEPGQQTNQVPDQQTNEDVPMIDIVEPGQQTNQVPGQQTNEDVPMIDIVER